MRMEYQLIKKNLDSCILYIRFIFIYTNPSKAMMSSLAIKNLKDLLYTAEGKKWLSILHVSDICTLQRVQ